MRSAPSLGGDSICEALALPRGSSDFISFRPPRPSDTLTLRVICPAPQDIVPEKANEYEDDVGGGYVRTAG